MERIRAAIDKAREERQSNGQPAPDHGRKASEGILGDTAKTGMAAWLALRTSDVSLKQLKRNRIITQKADRRAAPFDVMRTKLLHELKNNGWRRVAITAPATSCGKSAVCLNLAFSLARQSDLRVMVIELDLRRPSLAQILNLGDHIDFSRALAKKTPPEEHIVRVNSSLAIAASKRTANSAELLQGSAAAHVIDEIEARYQPDVMLFDMPPMLVVDDTMAFVDQVDATLLVTAAEKTKAADITRCQQELEDRTNLLGVVLNRCRYLDGADGYA